MDAFIELLKILIPGGLVLYAAWLLVRAQIQKEIELKRLEVRGRSSEVVIPNRLQAYERMTLFLERMSPENLLVRLNTGNYPSHQFHQLLLSEIRSEYNHNASQQVYMTEETWSLIRSAREDLILTINDAAGEMGVEATSMDLSRKILEKYMTKAIDPIAYALSELKKEIQQTF